VRRILAFLRDPRVVIRGRPLDLGVIVALAWIFVAAGVSAVFGPRLGLRGLCWLAAHHLLCLAGAAHELRRGWRRRRLPPPGQGPTR
jgi:hypothetical protein